ncbi:hypothetical protein B484DRAFT_397397 [Ochromonadaceae sp. CCMP2298]|nr:hypothetical protein B484DRAFT_397397 [Ochromonadaceae sp. CCMP2298]
MFLSQKHDQFHIHGSVRRTGVSILQLRRQGGMAKPVSAECSAQELESGAGIADYMVIFVSAAAAGIQQEEARVDFFVQVPSDVTPEEKFRVTVGDCEVILVCPDICAQGERIVLRVLRDSDK